MLKQSSPFFKVYSQLFSIHVHVDNLYIISLYFHFLCFNYQPAFLSLLKVFKLYKPFVSLALPVFSEEPLPQTSTLLESSHTDYLSGSYHKPGNPALSVYQPSYQNKGMSIVVDSVLLVKPG